MDKKYTPHIRIPFSLFDSAEYKQIPDTLKPYCLSVLTCLLKFVNTKSGKCYPRRSTISSMTGLSISSIYRATEELKKAKIIHIKRLPSTLLYIIEPKFIFGDMSNRKVIGLIDRSDMSNRQVLIEHNLNITNINNLVKRISKEGGSKDKIVNELATLPIAELEKAIENNDNPYFCRLALEIKSREGEKLVEFNSKDILERIRKKTNFAYQRAIDKNKKDYDRKIKSKDLLRSDFKTK